MPTLPRAPAFLEAPLRVSSRGACRKSRSIACSGSSRQQGWKPISGSGALPEPPQNPKPTLRCRAGPLCGTARRRSADRTRDVPLGSPDGQERAYEEVDTHRRIASLHLRYPRLARTEKSRDGCLGEPAAGALLPQALGQRLFSSIGELRDSKSVSSAVSV